MFLRKALVEGDWHGDHAFLERNRELIEEVRALEERARRRDVLVDEDALVAFYDARVPESVVSGAQFDRWWRDESRAGPDLLTFTYDVLVREGAEDALDVRASPSTWRQDDVALPLSYRFEPGAEDDGVTAHIPIASLANLSASGFEWLVPSLREELVTALIRSLPKEQRRSLVPAPEVARQVLARMAPRREPLLVALSRELERARGVRVEPEAFDLTKLPPHLRMTFRVHAEDGSTVATGESLAGLRAEVRPRLQQALSRAARRFEQTGLRAWTIGELPRVIALPGTGQTVRAYPALVDEGDSVGVRVFDAPGPQQVAMWHGTRRLLRLHVPSPAKRVLSRLPSAAQLSLAATPHGSANAALEDAETAALDALVAEAGGPAWDEASYERLQQHVAGALEARTAQVVARVVRILDAERDVVRRLEQVTAPDAQPACRDVARQLGRLLFGGFIAAAGVGRLPDVERYLRGAASRLERLPNAVAVDRDRMRAIRELESEELELRNRVAPGMPIPEPLREARWMIEELRVSQFAQGVGVRGQVSAKRVRRLLDQARG
jgi:ATP-dependent helicase HrpA